MKYRLVIPAILLSFSVSAVNSDATNDCVTEKVHVYTAQTGIKGPDIDIPIVEEMYKQCGGVYGDDEWDYDLDENLDKVQQCEEAHLNAFQKQNGEDAVVSRDMLDEWTVQCGGRVEKDDTEPVYTPPSQPKVKPQVKAPNLEVTLSSRTNQLYGYRIPIITITNIDDRIVEVYDITVNRGGCRFSSDFRYQNALRYGKSKVFESQSCRDKVREVVVGTNFGQVNYKL